MRAPQQESIPDTNPKAMRIVKALAAFAASRPNKRNYGDLVGEAEEIPVVYEKPESAATDTARDRLPTLVATTSGHSK